MGKLVLHFPDGSTRDVLLNKERVTIGRRADNDVALPTPAVSGEHAAVVTVLDDSFLEDLGSTNGTYVNDKPVTKHFLRDRDRIDIGGEVLVYYADDAAEAEPLPAELLSHHEPANVLAPLDAHLAALADLRKGRSRKNGGGVTEPRPVVAEFDPQSVGPMTGQVATEFDAPAPQDASEDTTQRVRIRPELLGGAAVAPSAPGRSAASELPTPHVDAPAAGRAPVVRVIDGPSAGREIAVDKDELRLGRVGVAVVALRRSGEGRGVRLVPLEGIDPPRHNGAVLAAEGVELHPGDTFDVAGTTLVFAPPG